jgi:tRNA(fMet)-specific endonuclease VapC
MIVADTDVLIDYLANRPPAAGRIVLEIQTGGLCTTAVTRFELLAGARTERQSRMVHSLLDVLRTLPLDQDAADRAAEVRRDLERRGEPIGMADSLIAGIVLARGGLLLTRNRTHFERVTGLQLTHMRVE